MIGVLFAALLQGATPAGAEARIDLIQASHAVERAESRLEQARLRYSAARTGQHNKGSGPWSFTNPGSRKRWAKAVEDATAEVAAEADLASASQRFADIQARVCALDGAIPECSNE